VQFRSDDKTKISEISGEWDSFYANDERLRVSFFIFTDAKLPNLRQLFVYQAKERSETAVEYFRFYSENLR